MAMKDQVIDLPDGRVMGLAQYGDAEGYPVVVCHGTPGSRLILRFADQTARDLGLRLIIPDRPGYGLSSEHPGGSLLDWARDLGVLMDHFALGRIAVVGVSGGSPYALAAAHMWPEKVALLQVISGLAPFDQEDVFRNLDPKQRTMTRAFRGGSVLLKSVLTLASGRLSRLPDALLQRVMRLAPGVNGPLSANPLAQQAMADSFREAFRHGGGGLASDLTLFSLPWGFSVSEIDVPVRLWHGEADTVVPVGMGQYLASRLSHCEATFLPEAGHYWVIEHVDEVLNALKRSQEVAGNR